MRFVPDRVEQSNGPLRQEPRGERHDSGSGGWHDALVGDFSDSSRAVCGACRLQTVRLWWLGIRVMFIFVMAMVPIMSSFLNEANRLALILILLFAFNLSRGISSAGWLPWISSLVPASIRGRYLVREQASVNLASFGSFVLAGACLDGLLKAGGFR